MVATTIAITINGKPVEARPGEMLLDVIRRSGVDVPTLCNVSGLTPTGACRLCSVEVEGQRGLVPSCAYPVADGLSVRTHSPRAVRARKTIVELLLASHPDDCLYCPKNGRCQLQSIAQELGVRERVYHAPRNTFHVDLSSPSLVRDPAKCILCGRCVRVCEEIQAVGAIDFIGRGSQAVVGTAFGQGLNVSSCINCGQCILVCPTAALREQCHIPQVLAALDDPEKYVVVQHAPAISVSLAEEFGLKRGTDVNGVLTTALRELGFKRVFETSFSADLTIMEEASELAQRIREKLSGGSPALPMLTSCSPGWVKFVEQFYPDFLPNLSTCKSPQQMLGALIKSFFAEKAGLDPARIYSVAVMPCTAKKFEAQRPEMSQGGLPDIDAVLTTRELADLFRLRNLNLASLDPESPDTPFGERSTAGKLFGASGGVMEAALRTANYLLTGSDLEDLEFKAVRGMEGIKEATVQIGELRLGVAVASGLANAGKLLDAVRDGRDDLHFIEVMTCRGGCVGGGGQPLAMDEEAVRERMKSLHRIDRTEKLRTSHENPGIRRLYAEFLGQPLGERSHRLLHTHYHERDVVK
ncbi:MAG: iron hydrogenase small subunit [Phycisphaerales bacterium]|nr:iron hydrogenase small subunit [Phycisphaerales bacterium]